MLSDNFDNLSISPLDEEHTIFQIPLFDCSNPNEFSGLNRQKRDRLSSANEGMNRFLKEEAYEEQEAGLNRTFLLFYGEDLAGYISLCTDSITLSSDEKNDSELPYETVPSMKIARLAISKSYHRRGLGKYLVDYAVSLAFKIREFCGIKFLTVDCHDHRISYYQKLQFIVNGNQLVENSNLTSLHLDIDSYLESMEI